MDSDLDFDSDFRIFIWIATDFKLFRLALHSRIVAHIRKSIETDNKRFSTSCYVETDIETLLQEICEIFYTIFYGTGTGWRDPFESCFTSV